LKFNNFENDLNLANKSQSSANQILQAKG